MLKKLSALFLLVVAQTLNPAFGQSAGTGGAGRENGGEGFGCAHGTTYQMVNGIARCALPAAAAAGAASCSAAVLTQGACSFSFPYTTSGSSPSIATNTPGYAGAAQATCSNGAWGSMAATCGPNPCTAMSATFQACSFNLPSTASGTSPSVSTTTSGFSGVGQATCNAGVWSPLTASCVPNGCAATTSAYGSCTFAVPTLSSGQVVSVSNTASGFTGTETASCAGGTLSFSSQSCAPVAAAPCPSAMLSWGGGCNASAGSTASGGGVNLTNIASGFTGTASAVCSNGNWSSPVGSCTPAAPAPCAPGTIGWGPGNACTAAIPTTSSGSSASVTNATAGYVGSATFDCAGSPGAWQTPSAWTCHAACPAAPASTQTLACAAGQTGTITQTRTEECDASTNWAWNLGSWAFASNTCQTKIPTAPPSDAQVASGSLGPMGCDDTIIKVMTGTYTATTTWNRSWDGRGAWLGYFVTKRIQDWTFNGLVWAPVVPTTDTTVNYGQNVAHYCQ